MAFTTTNAYGTYRVDNPTEVAAIAAASASAWPLARPAFKQLSPESRRQHVFFPRLFGLIASKPRTTCRSSVRGVKGRRQKWHPSSSSNPRTRRRRTVPNSELRWKTKDPAFPRKLRTWCPPRRRPCRRQTPRARKTPSKSGRNETFGLTTTAKTLRSVSHRLFGKEAGCRLLRFYAGSVYRWPWAVVVLGVLGAKHQYYHGTCMPAPLLCVALHIRERIALRISS